MKRLYKLLASFVLLLTIVVSCKTAEDTGKISSFDQLAGRKVAVCTGTTVDLFLQNTYPDIIPYRVDGLIDIVAPVLSGQAAAGLSEIVGLQQLAKENPTLYCPGDTLTLDPIGMVLKDAKTSEDFNIFLNQIKESGELDRIIDKWNNDDGSAKVESINFTGENGKFIVMADMFLPFYSQKDGEWCGIDVEIFSRYCQERGLKPEFGTIPFASGLMAVSVGKIDAFCGGITITEERKKKMSFSDAYTHMIITYILPKASFDLDSREESEKSATVWAKISDSFHNNLIKEDRYKLILDGLKATIIVSLLSIILGTLLGMLVCWMRMNKNKILKNFAIVYIDVIRGIPHLVLLLLMFYVVFASSSIGGIAVASITFAINLAAYTSEIFRSSIESIDKGQREAGIALGFSNFQTFYYIIVPQALRRILPVYKGEIVSMVKITSIVGYIAVVDLTKAGDIIRSRTFDAFFPLIFVAIIYLILSFIVSKSIGLIEKKYERNH